MKQLPKKSTKEQLEYIAHLEKLKEMQDNLPHKYGQKNYKWQSVYLGSKKRMNFLLAANQVGKAEWLENDILTTKGYKKVYELEVGDKVYGYNGEPTEILDFPDGGLLESYELLLPHGSAGVYSENHEFVVVDLYGHNERVMTIKEMYEKAGYFLDTPNYVYRLKISRPIQSKGKQVNEVKLKYCRNIVKAMKGTHADNEVYRITGASIAGFDKALELGTERMQQLYNDIVAIKANVRQVPRSISYQVKDGRLIDFLCKLILMLGGAIESVSDDHQIVYKMPLQKGDEACYGQKITGIRYLGKKWCRCLSVAHSEYRTSRSNITTHNSTVNIKKCIEWATNKELWKELWSSEPNLFWYFYPTTTQAATEFNTKWVPLLPKGPLKDHPIYGWTVVWDGKEIKELRFNSGVTIQFKTYNQKLSSLQSSTLFAVFSDEEMPIEYLDELVIRLASTDGYFHMVFTATLGQELWRKTMDARPNEKPNFPEAHKQTITMYDCLEFEDGSPGKYTIDRINSIIKMCKNRSEVDRRVFGKFILESGRTYESYEPSKHVKPFHPIPDDWNIYAGVDLGSGGANHPAAIVFVGVNPEYNQARVFRAWRGDGCITTAGDVLDKYKELSSDLLVTEAYYDFAAKDFGTIADRTGVCFRKANKDHKKGEQVLNTLFKYNMMYLYDQEEILKLSVELTNDRLVTLNNKRKNDLADALRYAVTEIPFDWTYIADQVTIKESEVKKDSKNTFLINERPEFDSKAHEDEEIRIENEFDEWNEAYGA